MRKFVTYFRVSTAKQGASGLGLDAQRESVANYIDVKDNIVATYTEVESGRDCDRPELRKAMDFCRLTKATLLIAKLDRLSRRVSFLSALMDGDVQFVAADNPHATRFTLHILAAVAEHEAEAISLRTKAALKAAKARGTKLGGWRGGMPSDEQRKASRELRSGRAGDHARRVLPIIEAIKGDGMSLSEVARRLNGAGITPPRGGSWAATTVARVLARAA